MMQEPDAWFNEELKFREFGLASGGNDPRSANQSFGGDWDKDQININYAYVNYSPFKWLNLEGGKIPRYYQEIAQHFGDYEFQTIARALGRLHTEEKLWQDARGRMCLRGSPHAAKPPMKTP